MRRILAVTAICLLVFMAPTSSGEHPWNEKRIHYLVEYNGMLQEKGYSVRHRGSYDKQPCYITEEMRYYFSDSDRTTPIRTVRVKTTTTLTGEALQRSEETVAGDPGHLTITVNGTEARFEASGRYGASDVITVPQGVMFEISGDWLARQSLRRGRKYTAQILDRSSRGVIAQEVEIVERLTKNLYEFPANWRAEFSSPGRPPIHVTFSTDGRLIRLESEGMVYQVVPREDYLLGKIPKAIHPREEDGTNPPEDDYRLSESVLDTQRGPVGSVSVPIQATVPAWDNFAWVILQAAPPHEWQNVIAASEYSQIDFNGVATNITALRNAPRVDAAATFPMSVPPEVQPFLAPHEAVPAVHPTIIDAAYMAVADTETRREEANVLRAVSYLAGWINQNIAVQEWSGYRSSALDTLIRKAGDSAGHARLFAAMARTLGVPTRVCQGFLAHTGRAIHHCWAEAWINGTWVPVDTTVSRVGLPAGYVMAERSGPDGVFLLDFVSFMTQPGLSLTLVSAGRETPSRQLAELVMGDRRTYAFVEGDWLANLYWGFALRLPPTWSGQAKLNTVELSSQDRQASVKCEALAGDYRAGQSDLESTIASLRSNLVRFSLKDSRVVSFDSEGATPALFIDFTCVQNNTTLRCRQYVLPRRQRAFRISFWAPNDKFNNYTADFDSILASFEF